MKLSRSSITILTLVLIIGILSSIAIVYAADATPRPTPPPFPTVKPTANGGGGNGGSVSTYVQPDVYPKIFQIKNSTGAVIGNATARSFSDVSAHVEVPAIVNGQSMIAMLDTALNSVPTMDLRMDLVFETPDATRLLDIIHPDKVLSQINITRCSGWNIKSGTLHVTVEIPASMMANMSADDEYYFVRMDGQSSQLLNASVSGPDSNGMIKFDALSPSDSLSMNSFSTYILIENSTHQATPTPTAMPTTTATPSPSTGSGLSTLTLLIMVLIPAVIAGLIIVYYEMLRKGK